MKILIIGGGGREHALAWSCANDAQVTEVFVAPGNAGTALEDKCKNLSLDVTDHAAVAQTVKRLEVEFVVVGPEAPLVAGLVDDLRAQQIPVWGPTQACAQLEGSKDFAKQFMDKNNIPTARSKTFEVVEEAIAYIESRGAPIVIKADGLAAGKGVVVAMSEAEAIEAVKDMLGAGKFGAAGARVVIEDFLEGEEASFICMIDGEHVLPLATSQDHKRIFEGDQGPNTGGMGAYSPAPVVTHEVHDKVMERIINPVVKAMKDAGTPYTGFLYAGLMIDKSGDPYVIEFNCRFGDPETQPVLMRLESSLPELIQSGLKGDLPAAAKWNPSPALGVVIASKGYPDDPQVGDPISGLQVTSEADVKVFHAGTRMGNDDEVLSSGGRVLCVTAMGETVAQAQSRANEICGQITLSGMQYRRDIGHQAIARELAGNPSRGGDI